MVRALLFDFAADAGEFGRGVIFERAVGLNLVAEEAQEFGEVDDPGGESADGAPLALHAGGGMKGDLAPFRGAVDDGMTSRISVVSSTAPCDAGFFDGLAMRSKAEEIEASTDAAEFADFAGEFLLGLDPG